MKSILFLLTATSCVVSPLAVTAQTPGLLQTFNNPTPGTGDYFGTSLAALGTNRVLIGVPYDNTSATNAGAVFLFHTNGTLLTTFTNPGPDTIPWYADPELNGDWFGLAVAGVGSDRVLIGAPQGGFGFSGEAYLFSTNGALLATIGSPGYLRFGAAVAVFGDDRLIIGAPGFVDSDIGNENGAVFLLNTNGAVLATLNDPGVGQAYAEFGSSVATFGTDRVLVGARGRGSAYLFSVTGTLLMTFTNPAPTAYDNFGHSVAAVGTDRVFVGAPFADQGAPYAGGAYLFGTNGALLTTFTNPTPAIGDGFGARVAVLDGDHIIISSSGADVGGTNSGTAYVFSANGALLHTITNPTPAAFDFFGGSVAALGSDRVIIGAPRDDTGATDAGSAYLFSVPPAPAIPQPPLLTIRRTTTNTVVVSWPSAATGFALQQNTNGLSSVNWSNVTVGIQTVGPNKTLIVNPTSGSRFFRLFHP